MTRTCKSCRRKHKGPLCPRCKKHRDKKAAAKEEHDSEINIPEGHLPEAHRLEPGEVT